MSSTASLRATALCLLCGVLAAALAGCGGTSARSTPAALKLQREDLVVVADALAAAERPVDAEVTATKSAWPLIANGLPANTRGVSGSVQFARATQAAAALRMPAAFGEAQARTLTGSAAQLAGLFRSYALLSARGWKLLGASLAQIDSGTPSNARFAAANAALYIGSIYDGHFTLAQIGKKLLAAYDKLGGATAFGAALTQGQVDALAHSYSEASDRLHPHVGVRIGT